MGFEPTEHFCSTAFKAVALTQTLPTLHVADRIGFEPTNDFRHLVFDDTLS